MCLVPHSLIVCTHQRPFNLPAIKIAAIEVKLLKVRTWFHLNRDPESIAYLYKSVAYYWCLHLPASVEPPILEVDCRAADQFISADVVVVHHFNLLNKINTHDTHGQDKPNKHGYIASYIQQSVTARKTHAYNPDPTCTCIHAPVFILLRATTCGTQ